MPDGDGLADHCGRQVLNASSDRRDEHSLVAQARPHQAKAQPRVREVARHDLGDLEREGPAIGFGEVDGAIFRGPHDRCGREHLGLALGLIVDAADQQQREEQAAAAQRVHPSTFRISNSPNAAPHGNASASVAKNTKT